MRKEKRDAIRLGVPDSVANCRFLSKESQGKFQFAVWPIKNIAKNGVSILSDEAVTEGALAFLNIDLDVIMKTIGVIAKVIWCRKDSLKNMYEIGLVFSWWPKKEDEYLIDDYIAARLDYGGSMSLEKDKRKETEVEST
ncbi:MAG: PilZ domain-containing protein [Candidatus Omnitrophica bacterium]|nr:PilZ domain-containing protein [Candidatus Omnitrophota bacterium]